MLRRISLAVTALAGTFALAGVASAQPVTGLYIGAGGGANFMEQQQVRVQPFPGAPPRYGRRSLDDGWTALASVGWGFGNGLRVELEGNYRRNEYGAGRAPGPGRGREEKYGPMANVLFDLDIGSPYVFPYLGAGAGYQWVDQRGGSFGPGMGGGGESDGGFAYQAIAGLSFPIPPVVGLSLTAEYRYLAVAGDRNYGAAGGAAVKTRADFNHSLMLGLRYAFNVAPPAVAAAPGPTPPPAAEASRTYLVFFDWDRADLTPRARQVVAEAARATTRVQVTRIEVNGYTDTSGTPRYNQGLSVRRAQAVAAELTRNGVPRQAISVQGFGQTRLLVPTADGVREPQNRRVEIILR